MRRNKSKTRQRQDKCIQNGVSLTNVKQNGENEMTDVATNNKERIGIGKESNRVTESVAHPPETF